MAVTTLAELFLRTASYQKPDHMLHKVGSSFQPISTAELVDRVRRLSRALEKRGVERRDHVALMAENGPHWHITDFATLCRGAALVTVYPSLRPDQAAYIVADSGSKVVFTQTREQLDGLLGHRDELPDVELFVLIDDDGEGVEGDHLATMAQLSEEGSDFDPEAFGDRIHEIDPDDLATLVYTSGTTGEPKGVMLTHGNIVSNMHNGLERFTLSSDYTALEFLPLAHSYERLVAYAYFNEGITIAYAESVQTLAEDMNLVKPHLFVSVPRVYEKVLAKIQENVSRGSAVQQKIFDWTQEVAKRSLPYRVKGESPPGLLGIQLALADRLVFSKIKARLGGRFEFAFSGGAPLAREIAAFFWGAGISIYEGYGLTETSPVIAVNTPDAVKIGTVGRPISGSEVRIAEDGEILTRGPNVMRGYWNKPEATDEVIDEDGWFHTGDIGEIDEEGFLKITDRKKEIIVNAYGKNIAPAPIENDLKTSRFISQAVVIGDRRKFLTALIVPDFEGIAAWADNQGIELDASDPEAVAEHPKVRELIEGEVDEVNEDLANYEQIVTFHLVQQEFTIEGGELTPTQKVKRRVIDEKYQEQIDAMYQRVEKEKGEGDEAQRTSAAGGRRGGRERS